MLLKAHSKVELKRVVKAKENHLTWKLVVLE
jgi:hypothetical protein